MLATFSPPAFFNSSSAFFAHFESSQCTDSRRWPFRRRPSVQFRFGTRESPRPTSAPINPPAAPAAPIPARAATIGPAAMNGPMPGMASTPMPINHPSTPPTTAPAAAPVVAPSGRLAMRFVREVFRPRRFRHQHRHITVAEAGRAQVVHRMLQTLPTTKQAKGRDISVCHRCTLLNCPREECKGRACEERAQGDRARGAREARVFLALSP